MFPMFLSLNKGFLEHFTLSHRLGWSPGGVCLHSGRTPSGVQTESLRSPPESKWSPSGAQAESTRSPPRVLMGSNWKTSQFIVDLYHYINHHTTDYLCHKWCNPAPFNGSAPNLVIVENNVNGNPHYKHAFNSQACEQLNA